MCIRDRSDSVAYAKYNFENKQKGYKIDNDAQFRNVLKTVKASGFDDTFVVQEYIEGSDDSMFVYSAYVNSRHKVVAITGGKILMHDRTPELILSLIHICTSKMIFFGIFQAFLCRRYSGLHK